MCSPSHALCAYLCEIIVGDFAFRTAGALFTAAPSKRGNAPYHAAILHKRTMAGVAPGDLLDPYGGKCPEPTIFFELGCRATTSSSRRAEHHTHTHTHQSRARAR